MFLHFKNEFIIKYSELCIGKYANFVEVNKRVKEKDDVFGKRGSKRRRERVGVEQCPFELKITKQKTE